MKITLEDYHHKCEDGCCDTYGYDLFVDGNKIGSFECDDVHRLIELLNVWFNRLPKEAGLTKPDFCW
jgi:hypothetical protein